MKANIPAGSSIKPLIEGYENFRNENFEQARTFEGLVKHGQNPNVLMVACCDSRVDPAIVTGSKPGDLFVVRNIANIVQPFMADSRHHGTSAALEFGVTALEVSDIVVFGHSLCGGVRALMESAHSSQDNDFISAWMEGATPARDKVIKEHGSLDFDDQCHECEKESLIHSLNNLMTYPWIKQRVDNEKLFLHGWYFDMALGQVETYDHHNQTFVAL